MRKAIFAVGALVALFGVSACQSTPSDAKKAVDAAPATSVSTTSTSTTSSTTTTAAPTTTTTAPPPPPAEPPTTTPPVTAPPATAPPVQRAAPSASYANCTEARAAGVTPLYRGQPGYAPKLDRDGDGIACE